MNNKICEAIREHADLNVFKPFNEEDFSTILKNST